MKRFFNWLFGKKNSIFYVCVSFLWVSFFTRELYTRGQFGNYYLEQEIYDGEPSSWLWHNHCIVWSHITPLNQFSSSTFLADKKSADLIIQQIKNAEALIK